MTIALALAKSIWPGYASPSARDDLAHVLHAGRADLRDRRLAAAFTAASSICFGKNSLITAISARSCSARFGRVRPAGRCASDSWRDFIILVRSAISSAAADELAGAARFDLAVLQRGHDQTQRADADLIARLHRLFHLAGDYLAHSSTFRCSALVGTSGPKLDVPPPRRLSTGRVHLQRFRTRMTLQHGDSDIEGWASPQATGLLVFANGALLEGFGFGAAGAAVGEVCFNTAMTGYQEILTDPSYAGQIITFTFPHIGNVGVNDEDIETVNLAASARRARRHPARRHHRSLELPGDAASRRLAEGARHHRAVRRSTRARSTTCIRERGMPNAVIAHQPGRPSSIGAR